jgi:hypothetical protein
MSQVVLREAMETARPLSDLVPLIKEQLQLASEAAEAAAMPHWLKAGILLNEAKSQMSRGEFGPWCERHFTQSSRQLERYMVAARPYATESIEKRRSGGSLEDHLRGTRHARGPVTSRTAWHEPVREAVKKINFEALRQDDLKRADERDLQRQLALKLIDIGYKVLAAELHPDKKGGSREAMSRLNDVRARLKQHA